MEYYYVHASIYIQHSWITKINFDQSNLTEFFIFYLASNVLIAWEAARPNSYRRQVVRFVSSKINHRKNQWIISRHKKNEKQENQIGIKYKSCTFGQK